MLKTLRVRMYPDAEQDALIQRHFGPCRFVWNHYLELRTKQYHDNGRSISAFDPIKDLKSLNPPEKTGPKKWN